MSEYDVVVDNQKKILEAEAWANEVNYLLAQDGYIETSYNSGLTVREYHRGDKAGLNEVIQDRMDRDAILGSFGAVEADIARGLMR